MWVIDIRHWLNDNYDGPALPRLKLKVDKMKEIIICATSEMAGGKKESAPRCWRKPQRKPCEGILKVRVAGHDEIRWFCPACEDEGVISGWTGLLWDMSFNPNGITH